MSKGVSDEGLIFETSEDVEVLPTFDALGLKEDLLRGVYAYGFERPSAVQQRAILPILKGRDVIVQSQSGTGKTCVFCLGALQSVDTSSREPQALFLSPTRELAEQSQKVCLALGDYLNVQVHVCIGGKRVSDDIHTFEAGVQIVSGTPGRVFHMIQQRHFSTRHIKMLVLDEADEMLNRGFKEQVYDIYRYLPPSTQVVLVSATMPHEVLEMTHKFMNNPFRVLVKRIKNYNFFPAVDFKNDAQLKREEALLGGDMCKNPARCHNTLGCAMSHRRVYEKILAERWPCAMIFEDDAGLADNFSARVAEMASGGMPPFDIVLMGWCWSAKSKITPPDDMKSTPELRIGWPGMCIHAYIMSIHGALMFAQANTPIRITPDAVGWIASPSEPHANAHQPSRRSVHRFLLVY